MYWDVEFTDEFESRAPEAQRIDDMAKNFTKLRAQLSPERQRQNRADAARVLLEMSLRELRQNVTNLNQEDVAEILSVTQGYVSKLERQDDMLLSRLYAYVEALGGELEIRAKFPNREVEIKRFRDVEKLRAVFAPSTRHKGSA